MLFFKSIIMNGVWEKYVFSSRLEDRLRKFSEATGGDGYSHIFVESCEEPVPQDRTEEEIQKGNKTAMEEVETQGKGTETVVAAEGNVNVDFGLLSQPLTGSQQITVNQRATSLVTEKLGKYSDETIIAQLKNASDAVLLQFCSCVCSSKLSDEDQHRAVSILCQSLLLKLRGGAELCSRATLVAARQTVDGFPSEACAELLLPLLQSPAGSGDVLAGLSADTRAQLLRMFVAAAAADRQPLSEPQLPPLQALLCPGLDQRTVDGLAALLEASAAAFPRSAVFGKLLVTAAETLGPGAGPAARSALGRVVGGHRSLQRRRAEQALGALDS